MSHNYGDRAREIATTIRKPKSHNISCNEDKSGGDTAATPKKPSQPTKKILIGQLQKFGYHLGKRIGEGSYSKVYYAEHDHNIKKSFSKKPIACKIIDGRYTSAEFLKQFLPRELNIVQRLAHPHIISVYSILEIGPFICFFMDFCPHGDLLDRIRYRGPLSEKKAKLFFTQIASAIQYLHSIEIGHRDIKCENILIQSRFCVKLTDFGFARNMVDKHEKRILSDTFCGSAAYAAPEVLKGIPYDPRLYDMWSLGCVLYIMVTGSMPYDDQNIPATIRRQEQHYITYPDEVVVGADIKKLISGLLEPILTKRTTISDLIRERWLLL